MVEIGLIILAFGLHVLIGRWDVIANVLKWSLVCGCLTLFFLLNNVDPIKLIFLAKFIVWILLILFCCANRLVRLLVMLAYIGLSLFNMSTTGLSKVSSLPFMMLFVLSVDWKRLQVTGPIWLVLGFLQGTFLALRGHMGAILVMAFKPAFRFNPGLSGFTIFSIGSALIIALHIFMYYEIFYGGGIIAASASNAERSAMLVAGLPQSFSSLWLGADLWSIDYILESEYAFTSLGWSDGTLETDVHNFIGHLLKFGGIIPLFLFFYILFIKIGRRSADPVDIQLIILLVYYIGLHPFTANARMMTAVVIGVIASRIYERYQGRDNFDFKDYYDPSLNRQHDLGRQA